VYLDDKGAGAKDVAPDGQAAWPSPQPDIDIFYVNMFCYDTYMRLSD
jgi:hypothetical protein